jgi:SAM-dependent methyltransferase
MLTEIQNTEQFDQWLTGVPGVQLLETEKKLITSVKQEISGDSLALLGGPLWDDMLSSLKMPFTLRLFPHLNLTSSELVVNAYEALALENESCDIVVAPHLLEFSSAPRHLLAECERILAPEGYLVLFGVNPLSLWHWHPRIKFTSWHPHTMGCIERWGVELGLRYVLHERALYTSPARVSNIKRKRKWLENFGSVVWPFFGGVYMLVLQKNQLSMSPSEKIWQKKSFSFSRSLGDTT